MSAGDPWRYATVSAPGVTVQSTPKQPVAVGEGYHCADLRACPSFHLQPADPQTHATLTVTREGAANPTVAAVQAHGLASIQTWIAAWKPAKAHGTRQLDTLEPSTRFIKPLQGWFRTPVF
jgi:hypothetical protein